MLEPLTPVGFSYTNPSTFLKIRNVKPFAKHPFVISCLSLVSFFLAAFLLVFLFRSFFPDPGLRTNGYDQAVVIELSEANDGTELAEGWAYLGSEGHYEDGTIVLPSGSGLLSPIERRRATKYVSLVLTKKVEETSLSLKAYGSTDGAILEDTPIQEATPYFIEGGEGFSYEFRFSYDHSEIAAVSLEYNETSSSETLSIQQFTFSYFA